jgi:uncharacterized phage infection (PIP) family protein YhgE
MADEDDYELMPHREVQRLKEELSKIKGGESVGLDNEMRRAIIDLSEKIGTMNTVLEAASSDLREEDKEAEIIKNKIDPIMQKMTELAEQNEKIARGLVAIHDLVDEKLQQLSVVVNDLSGMASDIQEMKSQVARLKSQSAELPRPSPMQPQLPPGLNLGVPPPPLDGPQRMDMRPPRRSLF